MKNLLKILTVFILAACMLLATACIGTQLPDDPSSNTGGSSSQTGTSSGSGPDNEPSTPIPTITSAYVKNVQFGDSFSINNDDFYEDFTVEEKNLYYKLWEPETKITVEIDIDPYELCKIQEAYYDYKNTGNSTKADTYRRCNLKITVDGVEYYYEEVGIRMRGNTSRHDYVTEDGTIYDYVHFRFNLTETFDGDEYENGAWGSDIYHEWTDKAERKLRKNRTFATMEKFYYKWNKSLDNTYIREIYANKFFQAYGVLAPHITLCQLKIKQNGVMENFGVVMLYETIDKKFIKRNMEKSLQGGDLYKCRYLSSPATLKEAKDYGVETPTQRFNYTLKTNDDRSAPDYHHNAHLKALINTFNAVDVNDKDFVEQLNKVADTDYFTTFEAVNYLVGSPDCIRHNGNNYYLYFTPDGVGYFIPYDYDRCLGITMDWNPDNKGLTEEEPFERKGPNFYVDAPVYIKTVLGLRKNPLRIEYGEKIKVILKEKWFTYRNFSAIYEKYAENYSDLAKPSQVVINNVKDKVRTNNFYFSIYGTENCSSWSENLYIKTYINKKRATAEKAL